MDYANKRSLLLTNLEQALGRLSLLQQESARMTEQVAQIRGALQLLEELSREGQVTPVYPTPRGANSVSGEGENG